jgi:hypothetical protein
MATVVKAPYNIIIYSLTADDLTHQGQFWTLMSNTHIQTSKLLNCFITYFMSGPLTLQQNKFGWGKNFF